VSSLLFQLSTVIPFVPLPSFPFFFYLQTQTFLLLSANRRDGKRPRNNYRNRHGYVRCRKAPKQGRRPAHSHDRLSFLRSACGPPLIYVDQAWSIIQKEDSTGFSMDVCAVLIFSNLVSAPSLSLRAQAPRFLLELRAHLLPCSISSFVDALRVLVVSPSPRLTLPLRQITELTGLLVVYDPQRESLRARFVPTLLASRQVQAHPFASLTLISPFLLLRTALLMQSILLVLAMLVLLFILLKYRKPTSSSAKESRRPLNFWQW